MVVLWQLVVMTRVNVFDSNGCIHDSGRPPKSARYTVKPTIFDTERARSLEASRYGRRGVVRVFCKAVVILTAKKTAFKKKNPPVYCVVHRSGSADSTIDIVIPHELRVVLILASKQPLLMLSRQPLTQEVPFSHNALATINPNPSP